MCATRSRVPRSAARYGWADELWLPTWKLNPANCTLAAMTCLTSSSASAASAPNFDDRSDFAVGLRNASRTSSSISAGRPANFAASQGFSTTKVRMPAAYAWSMSFGFLIGLVWMHRSIGSPSCCKRSTSALVATSKPPPQMAIVVSTTGCGSAFTA